MTFTPSKYTRLLPHFDIGQAYYHLVFRLKNGFLDDEEIIIVKDQIVKGNDHFYRLIAVQVMGNHVHIVLQPNTDIPISKIVRGIKGSSARLINIRRGTSGSLWSDQYFDRIIRNATDFENTLNYIEYNPIKTGTVDEAKNSIGWKFEQE